jgi:hypothetical protein
VGYPAGNSPGSAHVAEGIDDRNSDSFRVHAREHSGSWEIEMDRSSAFQGYGHGKAGLSVGQAVVKGPDPELTQQARKSLNIVCFAQPS